MLLSEGTNGIAKKINNKIYKTTNFKYNKSDNLYYEYLTTYYLNKHINKSQFDIFSKTNGLYLFPTLNKKYEFFNIPFKLNKSKTKSQEVNEEKINKMFDKDYYLIPIKDLLNYSLIDYLCILKDNLMIELDYITNIGSLDDFFDDYKYETNDFAENMIYIFFIIYSSLYSLKGIFTHYDLGSYNVLIIKSDKPKKYKYKTKNGEIIMFQTKYYPKIIDYATSYIKNINKQFINKLCNANNCTPKNEKKAHCGKIGNFNFLNKNNVFEEDKYYRNSLYYSMTHDLYLINSCKKSILKKLKPKLNSNDLKLKNIIDKTHYISEYGSPPVEKINNKIVDIEDMYYELLNLVIELNKK